MNRIETSLTMPSTRELIASYSSLHSIASLQEGWGAGLLIRKHDHYTPAKKTRRDVRALTARDHPEGRFYPMERHAL